MVIFLMTTQLIGEKRNVVTEPFLQRPIRCELSTKGGSCLDRASVKLDLPPWEAG